MNTAYISKPVTSTTMWAFVVLSMTVAVAFDHEDCTRRHSAQHTMCQYMRKFGREYQDGEFEHRMQNVMHKLQHSAQSTVTVQYGLNSISDRAFVKNRFLNTQSPNTADPFRHNRLKSYKLPESLDLRDKLQPVKDQGDCGSCYTFSGVSVLEYHAGVSISEQKIMDCSSSENGPSYGCNGGWPENVFEYAKHWPVVLEKDMPYSAQGGPCNQTCSRSALKVLRYGSLTHEKDAESESRIPYILNTYGPVSVAIDVGTTELLMSYQNGTFPASACGKELDHAVTIVGYTPEQWIVRNSWSPQWGDGGYFYLERGANACGVAEYIGYVSKTQ